jgi:serine/threonine protein kinase
VLEGQSYAGPEADCWSIGVLLYALIFRANPSRRDDGVLLPPANYSNYDDCAYKLINGLMNPVVTERTTVVEAQEHEWLKDFKYAGKF